MALNATFMIHGKIMDTKTFYNRYPYPDVNDSYREGVLSRRSLSAPQNFEGNILVVGCGTAESIMIAHRNPNANVLGIDISETSLSIAQSLIEKYDIKNLTLENKDITEYSDPDRFDFVVASCVLHHIPNVDAAIRNIYASVKQNCMIAGSVYSDQRPNYIRQISDKKFQSVEELRAYLEKNPNEWYKTHEKNDSELADTWMNPYFLLYNKMSLLQLLIRFNTITIRDATDRFYFSAIK